MTAITFDTLEYSKTLQEAGVPQAQAEAMAKAHNKALQDVVNVQQFVTKTDAQYFATKSDIQAVKNDIQTVKDDIQAVKNDIQTVKDDLAGTKHELIKWMTNLIVALFVAQSALFVGIMAFMK